VAVDSGASTNGARLYLDENQAAVVDAFPIRQAAVNGLLLVGGYSDTANKPVGAFTGNIDDVRIYNGLLSTSEVVDLFNSRPAPSSSITQYVPPPLMISIGLGLLLLIGVVSVRSLRSGHPEVTQSAARSRCI